eukprot:gene30053-37208_t
MSTSLEIPKASTKRIMKLNDEVESVSAVDDILLAIESNQPKFAFLNEAFGGPNKTQ